MQYEFTEPVHKVNEEGEPYEDYPIEIKLNQNKEAIIKFLG